MQPLPSPRDLLPMCPNTCNPCVRSKHCACRSSITRHRATKNRHAQHALQTAPHLCLPQAHAVSTSAPAGRSDRFPSRRADFHAFLHRNAPSPNSVLRGTFHRPFPPPKAHKPRIRPAACSPKGSFDHGFRGCPTHGLASLGRNQREPGSISEAGQTTESLLTTKDVKKKKSGINHGSHGFH